MAQSPDASRCALRHMLGGPSLTSRVSHLMSHVSKLPNSLQKPTQKLTAVHSLYMGHIGNDHKLFFTS